MRRMYTTQGIQKIIDESIKKALEEDVVIENIKDEDGHDRFIEGNLALASSGFTGITFNYGRWSLSGTHLMIVVSGVAENNATMQDNLHIASASIPAWIYNKIMPNATNVVDVKDFNVIVASHAMSKYGTITLRKQNDILRLDNSSGAKSITTGGMFRIQFDLIVDNQ